MNDITKRLKTARVKRGLSKQEAAIALEISLRTLTRWESGKDEPRLTEIGKLVVLYQVELIWLFFGVNTGKQRLTVKLDTQHLNRRETELMAALYHELPSVKDPEYMFEYIVLRELGLVKDENLTPDGLAYCRKYVEAT